MDLLRDKEKGYVGLLKESIKGPMEHNKGGSPSQEENENNPGLQEIQF